MAATSGSGNAGGTVVRLLSEAYEMLLAIPMTGALFAMITANLGGGALIQWVVGAIAMLSMLLAKTVFKKDIEEAWAEGEEDARRSREELDRGDFSGVPKIVQKVLPYPDEDERRRLANERQRQLELIEQAKAKAKRPRKKDTSGKGKRGGGRR